VTIALALTLERTALSLAPLVITNNPYDDVALWLPEDGLSEPDFDMRVTYAPDSAYMPGRFKIAAVLDMTSIPCTIYARGTTTSALQSAKNELAAAVSQWAFDVTLTVDGVAQTWPAAAPSWPKWGDVDSGMVAAHIAKASFSIPLNPA
jgi:hypothetical protein